MTVRRISHGKDVDKIAREVADCMASGADDIQKVISYAVGEIINNVMQHSGGEGFLAAQRYENSVHFAVADSGMGLRRSFDGTKLEPELTTPLLALQKSMEPFVSSALLRPPTGPYNEYVNRGIGLSMVDELTRQTYGKMDVLTENAHFQRVGQISAEYREVDNLSNQGVLVSMHINTDEIDNFQEIITNIRKIVHAEEADYTPNILDEWENMFK
ncbi:MAG: hypothetical protein ACI9SQ_000253 [Rubritalea sp.]